MCTRWLVGALEIIEPDKHAHLYFVSARKGAHRLPATTLSMLQRLVSDRYEKGAFVVSDIASYCLPLSHDQGNHSF